MINVLIIDDSAFIREYLTKLLNEDNRINVAAAVSNPYKATEILNKQKIDVITLDIDLPFMDGLTFLEKLMSQKPIPVIIISGVMDENSKDAFKALQLGAVEIISKDKIGIKNFLIREKENIINSILDAYKVNVGNIKTMIKMSEGIISFTDKPEIKSKKSSNKIIVIGASTGGTVVLRYIFSKLTGDTPGIAVTQHMPELFTGQFSLSLNSISKMNIKEADDNDIISNGNAVIARGNHHLKIIKSSNLYKCRLTKDSPVNRHRPSIDVMFESAAKAYGTNVLGILLTGMGKDGALGLKAIKAGQGRTIVQNEKSCAVFGMPKAAIDIKVVDQILGIDEIIEQILNF